MEFPLEKKARLQQERLDDFILSDSNLRELLATEESKARVRGKMIRQAIAHCGHPDPREGCRLAILALTLSEAEQRAYRPLQIDDPRRKHEDD